MTVLTVGNPFFPIGTPLGGGSEQVAAMLDRAIIERGGTSIVVASEQSRPKGRLVALPDAATLHRYDVTEQIAQLRRTIDSLSRQEADIVHFHGVRFTPLLPVENRRVIVTLHVSRQYYGPEILSIPTVQFVAVSKHQAASFADIRRLTIIENGIDIDRYRPRSGKRDHLALLARICPEKGIHVALRIAHRLDCSLIVAGPVQPFPSHRTYFDREVAPLLDGKRRYVGPLDEEGKVSLLSTARCVLMPSSWPETSSLVAMEASSSGVPVVAYRIGALPEVVEHGATGILVNDEEEMTRAIGGVREISPATCRRRAELRFDSRRMANQYFACYRRLLAN